MTQYSAKQQDILSAAIQLFAQQGLSATTMEQVCNSAQVSKRTLYKHFANKDALFDAVVDLLIKRIVPLTSIQFIPNYDFATQLKHLARSAVSLLSDDDYLTLSRIVIIESMRSKEQAHNLNMRLMDCEKAMLIWFEDAANAHCLGNFNAEFAAAFFWGGLKKLTFWEQVIKWQAPLDEAALDKLIEQVCLLFCSGVTPRQ
ncbi:MULTISPECIES: TetR/AcrR family transcriptional regulator [Pseudoalteromonas]|uniref:TetR family transcriptional regulator n=1 Tax=Pseudoalteromonas amylolytica TaxID=1859457 RepID=A0A1S1MXJ0_9GAMM|nr:MULTISPECIES: TetR/AcrR family transcriptional regulator [Pseudoalteromonas]MCF6436960.1 TetR/AcrR family transcriptional regulator [Pseudoalteromonas sp. MMG022]OHU88199.1 TetR family transcriptional regulator [Pseudoalteromonas sp. JW3]OHU91639.1 TetR family transcriptional regulator [Pseudoalteromonas amylolytica]